MVTRAPHRAAIAVAILFILASIGLTLFVWRSLGGELPLSPKGYRIHVLFSNASQLATHADVRVAGVDVGHVVKISQHGLRTDATIELDPHYAPIASDAHATLRQKTLLGETFVSLTMGSHGAPRLKEGGMLATANVAPTQPLDRVLGVLDARTRGDIRALFTNGADTLAGRSESLNNALGNIGPVTDELAAITGILDHQRGSVRTLVHDAGTVLRTVGAHGASLARLAHSADSLLAATDSRNTQLTETIRELGPLLVQLRSTSAAATTTAHIAAPVLHELRPVAPLVEPAARALQTLTPQVTDVLGQLNTALPIAERALPHTGHLVRALIPFIDILYPATREITPIIDLIAKYRKELVAEMANSSAALEGTSPGADGKPVHYLRALVPFDEEASVGYAQRLPSNRHNAYFAPGGMEQLSKGGLLASDCRNTTNAQTVPVIGAGAPPCKLQPPWTFDGSTQYFPHLERVPKK